VGWLSRGKHSVNRGGSVGEVFNFDRGGTTIGVENPYYMTSTASPLFAMFTNRAKALHYELIVLMLLIKKY